MKPFKQAVITEEESSKMIEETMEAWRNGDADARAMLPASDEVAARACIQSCVQNLRANETVWKNDRYQVNVRPIPEDPTGWPAMVHLSIKRIDRATIHDWRDLQDIKNMIVGAENDAVELYPAEDRRVDTANQYHLWVLADPLVRFPFGFADRLVLGQASYGKTKQRPLA